MSWSGYRASPRERRRTVSRSLVGSDKTHTGMNVPSLLASPLCITMQVITHLSASGAATDLGFSARHQEHARIITFGRDRLGRRSLLINPSASSTGLTIASVGFRTSGQDEAGDVFQEVDCQGFWRLRVDEIVQETTGNVSPSSDSSGLKIQPSVSFYK